MSGFPRHLRSLHVDVIFHGEIAMTHRSLFASGVFALALASQTVAALAQNLTGTDVPPVPATLEVPEGQVVYLATRAYGTQNYICLPAPAGAAWKFLGPQ